MNPTYKFRVLMLVGLLLANVFVVALGVYDLWRSHQHYEHRATVVSQNMARAAALSIARSVDNIDHGLQAVSDELERQLAHGGINNQEIASFILRQESRMPDAEAIRIADADGLVRYGKGVDPQQPASWADREYFLTLRDNPQAGLQISKPRMGRVAKQWIIGFARRYNFPDGRFAGVISAPIALERFQSVLSQFQVGERDTIVLRLNNLELLARYPQPTGRQIGVIGSNLAPREVGEFVQQGVEQRTAESHSTSDGVVRVITSRRLDGIPMFVSVGVAKEDFLANWYDERDRTVILVLLFMLLSGLSAWLLFRLLLRMERENLRNSLYLRNAADGIHILNCQGYLIEASDAFCRMLGYERHELVGMHVSRWDAQWTEAQLMERMQQWCSQIECEDTFETLHRTRDGHLIDVEINCQTFDWDGVRYFYASSRDITERQRQQQALRDSQERLRHSEERYRLLLKHSPVGILHYTPDLVVSYANDCFADIMQVPRDYMQGLDCKRLRDQSVLPALRAAIQGEASHYQGLYVTSFGAREVWIDMVCAPLRNDHGDILGGIAILDDISERIHAQQALEQLNRELSVRTQEAEAANRAKSQFLATMSHELRTPMNAILGMAQLLDMPDLEDSEKHEYVHTILDSGKSLMSILNDILDMSKIEAGAMQLQSRAFAPDVLLRDIRALFAPQAEQKGVMLQAVWQGEELAMYVGDSHRLRQMLSNLIGNACKFTDQGTIEVSGRVVGTDSASGRVQLEFAVQDSGIGIPADKLDRLFRPFSQVDAEANRRFGGTGLGLSIVKRMAELMDGEVGVSSEAGRGSRFWFRVWVDDMRDVESGVLPD